MAVFSLSNTLDVADLVLWHGGHVTIGEASVSVSVTVDKHGRIRSKKVVSFTVKVSVFTLTDHAKLFIIEVGIH